MFLFFSQYQSFTPKQDPYVQHLLFTFFHALEIKITDVKTTTFFHL